ncbi:ultraviolet-B receptor UVR8 [Achlya hypogyna]|uniref:Ultraviolet-B receptor UVR8 n=1 Tax=Achlya hypogyna TaxID=1202772 RepID=A0A1V9YQ58_ACHHY|nr:ultraviolet-B receptor UVR8 [Achlya hypogyna]
MSSVECLGGYGSFPELAESTFDEDEVIVAAAGPTTILAVCKKAGVLGWGRAFHGELGPSRTSLRWRAPIASVACGGTFVLASSETGQCFQWGNGVEEPVAVDIASPVVQAAAGEDHALALTSDGVAWAWGENLHGQCGAPIDILNIDAPAHIKHDQRWKHVAAGAHHTALITLTGELYTMGWGLYHQLGHGSTADLFAPECVTSLLGVGDYRDGAFSGLTQVSCGAWHTVALTTTGDIYTWGWGQHGQLGGPTLKSHVFPTLVPVEDTFVAIACGTRHTAALTSDGFLHRWGFQPPSDQIVAGKSSDPNTTHSKLAVPRCVRIAAGGYHTVLVHK